MELEYADDADGTLKKYSYEVISGGKTVDTIRFRQPIWLNPDIRNSRNCSSRGGKTVDTVKAYKPADGGTAFVIETDGKDGAENGLFYALYILAIFKSACGYRNNLIAVAVGGYNKVCG